MNGLGGRAEFEGDVAEIIGVSAGPFEQKL
jgi:hypothetical protein